uniref:RBR-type E3 ubiquitin transferase n=1 Tax=Lygus hesperus TaxID=30085 RepID=A0A0A9XDL8_LYGHE
MSDEEDQADEVLALQSIYNGEEFSCVEAEDGLKSGKFHAFLSLPAGFHITFKTYSNGSPSSVVIPLEHLPPITLSFKLPKNYPSESSPEFELSCPWLTVTKLLKLCEKLEALWNEWKGSVILYTWTNFLKEESMDFIGVTDVLDITRRHLMELRRSGKLVDTKRNNNKRQRPLREAVARPPFDPRVVIPPLSLPLHQFLESYNDDRSKTTFLRNIYHCSICFQETAGSNCLQFHPCSHVYCKQCMEQYFTTRIKDAMVSSMPCPYEKCTSEANPHQVKDAVGALLFNKYDSMLLSVTLDKMDDITYCPRTSCGSPVMREKDEKMAACPACRYVFCVFCRRAYHGVEFCRMKSVEMKKIVQEYQEGDAAVKSRLEKRYGAAQIRRFINDMLSDDWIQTNSKNCPNCEASIEKSDGCNKMVCGKCQAFFCWLCLAVLDRNNPYSHFMDANSRCRNQLFLGLEGDPDVEDDEEDVFDEDFFDAVEFDGMDDDIGFHFI